MPKAKAGGYHWAQDLAKVRRANQKIRRALQIILDDKPGPQTLAVLLTRISLATAESDEAVRDLEQIGDHNYVSKTI